MGQFSVETYVHPGSTLSRNQQPEAKGVNKLDFAAAMKRLLTIGAIELDAELWRGPDRKPRHGIRLVEVGE